MQETGPVSRVGAHGQERRPVSWAAIHSQERGPVSWAGGCPWSAGASLRVHVSLSISNTGKKLTMI